MMVINKRYLKNQPAEFRDYENIPVVSYEYASDESLSKIVLKVC